MTVKQIDSTFSIVPLLAALDKARAENDGYACGYRFRVSPDIRSAILSLFVGTSPETGGPRITSTDLSRFDLLGIPVVVDDTLRAGEVRIDLLAPSAVAGLKFVVSYAYFEG